MRLSNGFVIDKEKTFGELKFTAVRDVFLQNEDGTPSTQLKKRIYDLKCSLHGGIIPVSVPPEVPLRAFPYNAVVELVNPVADTVSRKTYTGADVDWYVTVSYTHLDVYKRQISTLARGRNWDNSGRNSMLEMRNFKRLPVIPALQTVTGITLDRKSTRLNSSHSGESRMPSSA